MKCLNPSITFEHHGFTDYQTEWEAMKAFTENRSPATPDEYWLTQHHPVYTLGLNIKAENYPFPSLSHSIPLVATDRGGQITYHGPGQCIVYVLVDLKRRRLAVKELVRCLEAGTLRFLADYGIQGHLLEGAPGVYVEGEKIAALGLKIRRGCTYHGLSLNVDMDLSPFRFIHPCGYEGLRVTQLRDLKPASTLAIDSIHDALANHLAYAVDHSSKLLRD